jgi:thymidylate synthase (FAD)
MPHLVIPEAEELLDKEFKVLDRGFVRLVDYMGGDQRIVDAARVSYQAGTKKANTDSNLIRYLLRHKHTTPFEKVRFEFHIKIPIFVMRQWIRHRMSSTNEESARYSVMKDEFYVPDHLRGQAVTNRQGSSETIFKTVLDSYGSDGNVADYLDNLCSAAYQEYESLIKQGVARELARMVLPINLYTQFYWTIDLWNLMGFLRLRLDSHAQLEIQECARPLEMMANAVCPVAMSGWKDYIYDAVNFSRMEVGAIRSFLSRPMKPSIENFEFLSKGSGMETRTEKGEYSREFKEFLDKLDLNEPVQTNNLQQST